MTTYFTTITGRKVNVIDPNPDDVSIHDIAGSLARQCRFNGHVRQYYSVAQHSVNVCALAPENVRVYALLHDAHEAYIGDIISPLRIALGDTIDMLAMAWDEAVYEKFGVKLPTDDEMDAVLKADRADLLISQRTLRHVTSVDHDEHLSKGGKEHASHIVCGQCNYLPQDPETAERVFLNAFSSLGL